MFDTAILEVAIGLAFVYLLLSLLVSALFEVISSVGRLRHKELWRGLQLLLSAGSRDHPFARTFMEHPLIKAVSSPSNLVDRTPDGARVFAPSNLSRELFTSALLDSLNIRPAVVESHDVIRKVVSTFPTTGRATDLAVQVREALSASQPNLPGSALAAALQEVLAQVNESTPVASLQERILARVGRSSGAALLTQLEAASVPSPGSSSGTPPIPFLRALETLARQSNGDLDDFKARVGLWFEEGMSRSSGWFRRRALYHTLMLAALVTVIMNVDSIQIVRKLSTDSALRRSLVAQAEAFTQSERGRDLALRDLPQGLAIARGTNLPSPPEVIVFEPNPVRAGSVAVGRIVRASKASSDIPYHLRIEGAAGEASLSVNQVVIPAESTEAGFLVSTFTNKHGYSLSIAVTNGPALFGVLEVLPDPVSEATALRDEILSLGLPMGWSAHSLEDALTVEKLLGLAITIIAISLGAPFWYDLTTKLLKLRNPSPSSIPGQETGATETPVAKPS